MVGGVATGIAAYLEVPTVAVRILFVASTVTHGVGIAVYAVFWVFLRQADGKSLRDDRREQGLLLTLLALAAVTLAVLGPLDLVPGGPTTVALLAAVAGIALVWQQADQSQRERWRSSATSTRGGVVRIGIGALLLVAGLIGFLASRGELSNARSGLLSTAVVVGGIALLSSPWWVTLTSDLRDERTARIRSQERAEVAAHLHDSVLQTLALIQKASGSPTEVTRLARSQERELRHWLYADSHDEGTLASALEQAAAQVEDVLAVPVEVVVVGDCPLDERTGALVAATKEAVVNAAKHSGAPTVDVYAEVEPALVSVFVRDRGRGFDPEAVPEDRHGLSGSVVGRMQRHGGTARVRSTVGSGTEITLELPRG
jgi:signal transduction histidine kinase/phage shock protein PspC (stress-responsive transcriptional regulator)